MPKYKSKPSYKIKINYFKPSGKYYASGHFMTQQQQMFDLFDDFKTMLAKGSRPGLVDGHSGFTAVLDCSEHPNGYPGLFIAQA